MYRAAMHACYSAATAGLPRRACQIRPQEPAGVMPATLLPQQPPECTAPLSPDRTAAALPAEHRTCSNNTAVHETTVRLN